MFQLSDGQWINKPSGVQLSLEEAERLVEAGSHLAVTEKDLDTCGDEAWKTAANTASVFARMSPRGKVRVVEMLQEQRRQE
eukprot:2815627-Amphidinium_carterae.1